MSNKKYRWHSSEGSCEKCQALNNTEYNSEKEIPEICPFTTQSF